ncbi:MAG: polysaccharide deacetylase family protein [Hydrogenoanaerobacterium sp.]
MYNAQNVRRIKIGIRMFLLCLTIIPTIILVFMFVQNNRLQKQMAELSQELDAAAQNIASAELTNNSAKAGKVVKKETSSDFIVEPGEFYNPYGKPILSVCSNMLVDWRMEPVQVSETPTVYLTFDDGPSSITEKVLDILDEYNVKATFFVVGSDDEYIHSLYRQIVRRGHTLAMHSYSHDYHKIYSSTSAFIEDMDKLYTVLKDTTGEAPVLFRFPGGANNDRLLHNDASGELIEEMTSRGFIYHDWNASGEDAAFIPPTKEEIAQSVIKTVGKKKHAVVLLHDSANKITTAQALPIIIESLQAKGYKFEKLTSGIKPVHFS